MNATGKLHLAYRRLVSFFAFEPEQRKVKHAGW
jgi:hypothetical protein